MSKKILIIDDSALMRRVISDIIKSGDEYEVAAIAKDGVEGYEYIRQNPTLYSAVILDINMPKMNGLQLLQRLQSERIEQTVIIVSTVAKEGAKETIQALEYGAFDFVTKPENYLETKSEAFKNRIHEMLNVATSTKKTLERVGMSVPKRSTLRDSHLRTNPKTPGDRAKERQAAGAEALKAILAKTGTVQSTESSEPAQKVDGKLYKNVKTDRKKVVALACSTGGPKSLQQVIPMLPKNLDAGVVLVQHMPAGFTASLAQRLDEMSDIQVKEAEDGDIIRRGHVYIAPGGKHLRIVKNGSGHKIQLSDEPAIEGLRPCANIMYESLERCDYDEITCVVLTGMGADGTKGIKGLSDKHKKMHIIAQNEDTCVVYGMPKAIAQTGLVDEVVPLNRVAEVITKNVGVS